MNGYYVAALAAVFFHMVWVGTIPFLLISFNLRLVLVSLGWGLGTVLSQIIFLPECPLTAFENILWHWADQSNALEFKSYLLQHVAHAYGLNIVPWFIVASLAAVIVPMTTLALYISHKIETAKSP